MQTCFWEVNGQIDMRTSTLATSHPLWIQFVFKNGENRIIFEIFTLAQ